MKPERRSVRRTPETLQRDIKECARLWRCIARERRFAGDNTGSVAADECAARFESRIAESEDE